MGSIPQYWRLQQHHYMLTGSACTRCGSKLFPARHICPHCAPAPDRPEPEPVVAQNAHEQETYILLTIPALPDRLLVPIPGRERS